MAEEKEIPEPAEESAGEAGAEQGGAEQPASTEQPEIPKEARNMAMLCHLLGLVGFIGPLIVWVNEKDKHKFVNEHGQTAINYQISIMLYYLASCLLIPIFFIGFLLILALIIMHIIFVIMGAVKANKGKPWRYPIAIRFIK